MPAGGTSLRYVQIEIADSTFPWIFWDDYPISGIPSKEYFWGDLTDAQPTYCTGHYYWARGSSSRRSIIPPGSGFSGAVIINTAALPDILIYPGMLIHIRALGAGANDWFQYCITGEQYEGVRVQE